MSNCLSPQGCCGQSSPPNLSSMSTRKLTNLVSGPRESTPRSGAAMSSSSTTARLCGCSIRRCASDTLSYDENCVTPVRDNLPETTTSTAIESFLSPIEISQHSPSLLPSTMQPSFYQTPIVTHNSTQSVLLKQNCSTPVITGELAADTFNGRIASNNLTYVAPVETSPSDGLAAGGTEATFSTLTGSLDTLDDDIDFIGFYFRENERRRQKESSIADTSIPILRSESMELSAKSNANNLLASDRLISLNVPLAKHRMLAVELKSRATEEIGVPSAPVNSPNGGVIDSSYGCSGGSTDYAGDDSTERDSGGYEIPVNHHTGNSTATSSLISTTTTDDPSYANVSRFAYRSEKIAHRSEKTNSRMHSLRSRSIRHTPDAAIVSSLCVSNVMSRRRGRQSHTFAERRRSKMKQEKKLRPFRRQIVGHRVIENNWRESTTNFIPSANSAVATLGVRPDCDGQEYSPTLDLAGSLVPPISCCAKERVVCDSDGSTNLENFTSPECTLPHATQAVPFSNATSICSAFKTYTYQTPQVFKMRASANTPLASAVHPSLPAIQCSAQKVERWLQRMENDCGAQMYETSCGSCETYDTNVLDSVAGAGPQKDITPDSDKRIYGRDINNYLNQQNVSRTATRSFDRVSGLSAERYHPRLRETVVNSSQEMTIADNFTNYYYTGRVLQPIHENSRVECSTSRTMISRPYRRPHLTSVANLNSPRLDVNCKNVHGNYAELISQRRQYYLDSSKHQQLVRHSCSCRTAPNVIGSGSCTEQHTSVIRAQNINASMRTNMFTTSGYHHVRRSLNSAPADDATNKINAFRENESTVLNRNTIIKNVAGNKAQPAHLLGTNENSAHFDDTAISIDSDATTFFKQPLAPCRPVTDVQGSPLLARRRRNRFIGQRLRIIAQYLRRQKRGRSRDGSSPVVIKTLAVV